MLLPRMDEHRVSLEAPREAVWEAVERYARRLANADHRLLSAALRTEPRSGFEVSQEIEGELVELSGRHRFADYRLVFALTEDRPGEVELSAISYAAFLGAGGRLYRALLLGTKAHVLSVRHMLRSIRRDL